MFQPLIFQSKEGVILCIIIVDVHKLSYALIREYIRLILPVGCRERGDNGLFITLVP